MAVIARDELFEAMIREDDDAKRAELRARFIDAIRAEAQGEDRSLRQQLQGAVDALEAIEERLQGAVEDTRRDALLFLSANCHAAAADDLCDYFEGALG